MLQEVVFEFNVFRNNEFEIKSKRVISNTGSDMLYMGDHITVSDQFTHLGIQAQGILDRMIIF